jgi:hypothetical protein
MEAFGYFWGFLNWAGLAYSASAFVLHLLPGMGLTEARALPHFLLAALLLAAVLIIRDSPNRAWLLSLMPAGWLLLIVSGMIFFSSGSGRPGDEVSAAGLPVVFGVTGLVAVAGLATIAFMKGARILACCYVAISGCFLFGAYFFAVMAVTGDWL